MPPKKSAKSKNKSGSQTNQQGANMSQHIINHLKSLTFTPVIDLSDYYSKIGANSNSDNNIKNVTQFTIDTSSTNLTIISDVKVFKEYESKNDILYGIILKDCNDPDSSIEIIHRYKKNGKTKMTIDQLYTLMSSDINTIKNNMVTKKVFKKEVKRLDDKIDKLDSDLREEIKKVDAKVDAVDGKVNALDAKVNKLKKDNKLK